MRTRSPVLQRALITLRRASRRSRARVYSKVAELLEKPGSRRAEVNIGAVAKHTKDGDIVLVPGRVLGGGSIEHRVVIGALSFSKASRGKVVKAGGSALTLAEFAEKHPEGKGVRVIGG